MKKKALFAALFLLILGVLASSCGKADFLEGTVWTGKVEALGDAPVKVFFVSGTKCSLSVSDGWNTDEGQYSGKGKNIIMDWRNIGTVNGTIDGDKMKVYVGIIGEDLVLKKQK